MFKHILVPTDGSTLSAVAARNAIAFARSNGASVTALTVSLPYRVFSSDYAMVTDTEEKYDDDCTRRACEYLGVIRQAAQQAGVAYDALNVFHEQPYAAIIQAAKDRNCDLIAMASHGRKGLQALVVGSVTTKVLTHSTIPVLVWRGEKLLSAA